MYVTRHRTRDRARNTGHEARDPDTGRGTQNTGRGTQDTKRGTPDTERGTLGTERGTWNGRHGARNGRHGARSRDTSATEFGVPAPKYHSNQRVSDVRGGAADAGRVNQQPKSIIAHVTGSTRRLQISKQRQ